MGRGDGSKKKRTNHNELERKRRQTQKTTMTELKEVLPAEEGEKSSTIAILLRAKEHILFLENKIKAQETELASLRKKPKTEGALPEVTVTPPVPEPPTPPKAESKSPAYLKKLEPLRAQNAELKEQVAALERELGIKHEEAESQFAVDPHLLSAAAQVLSS